MHKSSVAKVKRGASALNATKVQNAPVVRFSDEQSALFERLAALFSGAGDQIRVKKLQSLRAKWERGEMTVVCSGHFSAGKSTLINALLQEQVLPASPLPTSANAVRISFGQPAATAYLIDGEALTLTDLSDQSLAKLKAWCKAGDEVAQIAVSTPAMLLRDGLVMYDTPGVDSTDERHAAQTEDVLFAADCVLFVADYHHVMSDINFHFMRKLADEGKPIWLAVSQMDKHDEHELPFHDFAQTVKQALASWQIACEGIWYVAAREQGDAGLSELRHSLQSCARSDLSARAVSSALTRLLAEHEQWQSAQAGESAEQVTAAESLLAERERALQEQEERISAQRAAIQSLGDELRAITTQAILLPYDATERAVQYVLSLHPQFRTGFLSSAKRVAAEREERLQGLLQVLRERTQEHIVRHLAQALLRAHRAQEWLEGSEADELAALEEAMSTIDAHFVRGQVASGAGLDSAYGYAYAKRLDEAVRQIFLRFAQEVTTKLEERTLVATTQAGAQAWPEAPADMQAVVQRMSQRKARLARMLEDVLQTFAAPIRRAVPVVEPGDTRAEAVMSTASAQRATVSALPSPVPQPHFLAFAAQSLASPGRIDALARSDSTELHGRRQDLCERLQQAIRLCEEPVLRRFARGLGERLDRLNHEQYTVALFGAFSAGKSTLINALLGGDMLPVSPNPATAAISRVLPPTADSPHQTVRVRYKTQADLDVEVTAACQALGIEAVSPQDLADALKDLKGAAIGGERVAHHAFLHAVARGWSELGAKLGLEEVLPVSDFRAAVAQEERAAFAERIDLYVASEFADAGIILVDTPGADSINARHTDVSFRYLRDADAVLFVTYFNHAFAKADREFLEQVGRVKDALAYDSLHVVINAIDLAQDGEEVAQVKDYVVRELARSGVRAPRVYAVSSQLGALARQLSEGGQDPVVRQTLQHRLRLTAEDELPAAAVIWRASGVEELVADVLAHTRGRLLVQTLAAGEAELSRIRTYLTSRMQERQTLADDAERVGETWRQALLAWQEQWGQPLLREQEAIGQEIGELFYHLNQRFGYAQNDLLIKAFHPSSLDRATASQVEQAVAEWLRLLGLHLGQEARATAIRISRFTRELAREWCAHSTCAAAESLPFALAQRDLAPSPDHVPTIPTFSDPSLRTRIAQTVKRHFRQPEQFYERGGRRELGAALEPVAKELAQGYLQALQTEFLSVFGQWLSATCELWLATQEQELAEAIASEVEALRDPSLAMRLAQVLHEFPPAYSETAVDQSG